MSKGMEFSLFVIKVHGVYYIRFGPGRKEPTEADVEVIFSIVKVVEEGKEGEAFDLMREEARVEGRRRKIPSVVNLYRQ